MGVQIDDLNFGDRIRIDVGPKYPGYVAWFRGISRSQGVYTLEIGDFSERPIIHWIYTAAIHKIEIVSALNNLIGNMVDYSTCKGDSDYPPVIWNRHIFDGFNYGGMSFGTPCGAGRIVIQPEHILTIAPVDHDAEVGRMAKLFDHWDDIDPGDEVEVWTKEGNLILGIFNGFENECRVRYVLRLTNGCRIVTSCIMGIMRIGVELVEPNSFGEVLDE